MDIHQAQTPHLPRTQYNIGVCYGKGRGVARDLEKDARWYQKSAERGDAVGLFRYVRIHKQGKHQLRAAENKEDEQSKNHASGPWTLDPGP